MHLCLKSPALTLAEGLGSAGCIWVLLKYCTIAWRGLAPTDSVSVRVLEVTLPSPHCTYYAHNISLTVSRFLNFFFFLLQLENPTLEPPAGQQGLCLNYLPAFQSSCGNECLLRAASK